MVDAFNKHGVVSDVVDEAPQSVARIHYADSKVDVDLGNVLTPTQVQHQPSVEWDAEAGAYYTLIMTDPDAPSRAEPKFREWHHWVVVNIPGNKVTEGEVKSGYIGSGPPQGTGLHRYVFLVYKQKNGKQDFSDVHTLRSTSSQHRAKFQARSFAKKHDLGQLVAGNFYQAEFDDYVPKLYATFTD